MTSSDGRTTSFAILTTYEFPETTPISPLADRALEVARSYGSRHDGFVSCRVFKGEDRTSVVVLTEWVSREAFEAFRSSTDGQEVVAAAIEYHPKIRFLIPAGAFAPG